MGAESEGGGRLRLRLRQVGARGVGRVCTLYLMYGEHGENSMYIHVYLCTCMQRSVYIYIYGRVSWGFVLGSGQRAYVYALSYKMYIHE